MFLVPPNKLSSSLHTCSEACRRLSISKHSPTASYTHTCEACGKEFTDSSPNSRFCSGIHIRTCAYCGELFEASKQQLLSDTQTCSNKCRYGLQKQTMLDNYGVLNPANSQYFKDKIADTNMKRYGVKCVLSSSEIRKRGQSTSISKYGVNHPSKSVAVKSKTRSTLIARYGVPYVFQSNELLAKSKATCLEKYGVDNVGKSAQHIYTKLTDPSMIDNCMQFHLNPRQFIVTHFQNHLPSLSEIANVCGMRDSSAGEIVNASNCRDIVRYCYSKMEDEVYQFLVDITSPDTQIIRNSYKVIPPYEVDIYLPEYKIAIECNPTCTHNSSIGTFGPTDQPKSRGYHKMKSDMCADAGVFLFHIFGYEWSHRKDIIQSMIANILGCNSHKLYARKTDIREVSSIKCMEFLRNNHRQGGVTAKVRLGLYSNDQLVSVMTFSKMRNTIGTGSTDLSDCWELSRFCNKINTSVVGGASKLFKHFIVQYQPKRIRSFSDNAHTRGNLYSVLGFQALHSSDPGYVWVDLHTDKGYARNNAQKRNLSAFLKDDSIDLSKTETEIMINHQFVQVFDSGTILWEWRNSLL